VRRTVGWYAGGGGHSGFTLLSVMFLSFPPDHESFLSAV
jgi:hypothetical protein